jgi:hypothetical protein
LSDIDKSPSTFEVNAKANVPTKPSFDRIVAERNGGTLEPRQQRSGRAHLEAVRREITSTTMGPTQHRRELHAYGVQNANECVCAAGKLGVAMFDKAEARD